MGHNKNGLFYLPSHRRALATAISAVLAGGQSAYAQKVLEEIVVTATKRQASLQDIPQSITAFTSADIERRGFEGLDDYANQIPSLAFARREPAGTSVVFRGVASSGIQFGTNPSSGVYLDEQPITAAGLNPDPRLIDIERIEALSGPQGTLFGDASQSGTLRIITNKPDSTELGAWVDLDASFVDDGDTGYDVSGMVNVPLVENSLGLRLVGFTAEEAGYIDNVLSPSPGGTFDNAAVVDGDVNTLSAAGGRAALRWTPSDELTVDLSAIFQQFDADGFGDINFGSENLEQVRFRKEELEEDWYQVALTIERNFSFGDALFTASYFDRDLRYDADATDYQFAFQQLSDYYEAAFNSAYGTAYDFAFYDFGGDVDRGFATEDIKKSERFTVEARLATPADSASKWQGLIGVFYNRAESSTLFTSGNENFAGSPAFYYLAYNPYNLSINGLPPGSWGPTNNWFFGAYDQTIDNLAVFGEVSFDITDNFQITAGGRWYEVDRDVATFLGGLMQGSQPDRTTDFVFTDDVGKATDDGFVPKLNLTYRFDADRLVYFTYSEGFRSGGANALRPDSVLPRSFDSDEVTNFEAGAKTSWLNGQLNLNITSYYMIWEDIQIQVNDPQPTVFQLGIVNFPEAEILGAEAGFAWIPAEGWDVSGSLAYVDAEISKSATLFPGTGAPVNAVEGTQLPITPDWKGSLSVEYTFSEKLLSASPFVRFDYAFVGESINALSGLEATVVSPPPTIQNSYEVGDLRFGLDAGEWSATLYINNVWDERGEQFINNRWAKRRVSVNQPRTFGIGFRYNF